MRAALIAAYVAAVVVTVVGHSMLPPEVAIHFGAGGRADDWAPRWMSTALFLGLHTVMFVLFLLGARLAFRCPDDLINIPHRDYWLTAERRGRALAILERKLHGFGAVTIAWMTLLTVQTVAAHRHRPPRLDEAVFVVSLVAYLGYTAVWCVQLYRAYRRPSDADAAEPIGPG